MSKDIGLKAPEGILTGSSLIDPYLDIGRDVFIIGSRELAAALVSSSFSVWNQPPAIFFTGGRGFIPSHVSARKAVVFSNIILNAIFKIINSAKAAVNAFY